MYSLFIFTSTLWYFSFLLFLLNIGSVALEHYRHCVTADKWFAIKQRLLNISSWNSVPPPPLAAAIFPPIQGDREINVDKFQDKLFLSRGKDHWQLHHRCHFYQCVLIIIYQIFLKEDQA